MTEKNLDALDAMATFYRIMEITATDPFSEEAIDLRFILARDGYLIYWEVEKVYKPLGFPLVFNRERHTILFYLYREDALEECICREKRDISVPSGREVWIPPYIEYFIEISKM